jgi:hypothetical protein
MLKDNVQIYGLMSLLKAKNDGYSLRIWFKTIAQRQSLRTRFNIKFYG